MQEINVPQVDFSEKLSEQARVTAARAVREKIERLLCDNGFDYDKVLSPYKDTSYWI